MYLSKYARKVTLLVRGDSLAKGMSQYLVDQINETKNIRVWLHSSVIEVKGEDRLEAITVNDAIRDEKQTVHTEGLFIFIGAQPHTDWLSGVVARDTSGFILTGPDLMMYDGHNNNRPKGWNLERQPFLLETNIPGIFELEMYVPVH